MTGWRPVHWINAALCALCGRRSAKGWAYYADARTYTRFVCEECAAAVAEPEQAG